MYIMNERNNSTCQRSVYSLETDFVILIAAMRRWSRR
jgi:hypothetical protein